ncbi:hypothetical protein [Marinobacterium aestuariivivens]|uniref:Pilus assembly protein PilP n=1 Tax=Marinobacterium aestuariivivens TaxID=1698799 RepID=A0ABW1ZUX9_9GAMM
MRVLNGLRLSALLLLTALTGPLLAQDEEEAPVESLPAESLPPSDAPDLGTDIEPDASLVPAQPDPMQLPPFPPRSQFDDMLQRPLFHSSRRPQAEDTGSGGSAQELRETWKLTGIVIVGDEVKALFQERNGDRRLTLGAGMPLDANWILDEINAETVTMGSGDEQVTLELLEPRDMTPVAAPEQGAGDEEAAEPGTVEERTRAASRQLEQDAESATETPDE